LLTARKSKKEIKTMNIQAANVRELKGIVKGGILVPDEPRYEEARQIWNAMIDRRPALIVQCADADDVAPAIAFARKNQLEISIRGGGHNIAGNALCDGALTIDFSNMKNVRVDAAKKRAYVEPGATLASWIKRPRCMVWPRRWGLIPLPVLRD